jgi:hypothetical protein
MSIRVFSVKYFLTFLLLLCAPAGQAQKSFLPQVKAAVPEAALAEHIRSGLGYLRGLQHENGSWGTAHTSAMTGLMIKALLLADPKPDEAVRKGAEFLLATALAQGKGWITENVTSGSAAYENAIGLEALALYQRSGGKHADLEQVIAKAVELMIKSQQPLGGWSYHIATGGYDPEREDLSVTWWQCHALNAVLAVSPKNLAIPKALMKATKFISEHGQKEGGIGQQNRARGNIYSQYSLTGASLSALTLVRPNDRTAVRGAKFILDELTKHPLDWAKNADLYAWYGTTIAFRSTRAANPAFFQTWTEKLALILMENQQPDGFWPKETGSIGFMSTTAAGADEEIYRGCLCVLMLELMRK